MPRIPATSKPSRERDCATGTECVSQATQGLSSEIKSYESALDYLFSRINYEKSGHAPYTAGNYRLDRMRLLLSKLGDPHLDYPIIHVAGTKGKGTTSALIADGLAACGHQVGFYSSPHLLRIEERIRIQGLPCSPSEFVNLTHAVAAAAKEIGADGCEGPTFFELTTAMGMLHFSQKDCTAVVLEVGLGGRLDSTNVCEPIVSVITSISLDHQTQLGNTIAEIAGEKAGIIKSKVPVICIARDPEARDVVVQKAELQNAPLELIDRDFSSSWQCLNNQSSYSENQTTSSEDSAPKTAARVAFDSKTDSNFDGTTWNTSMIGRHQKDNIAGAVATFSRLQQLGWQLPLTSLQSAVQGTSPQARLEIVRRAPLTIVDTAHNQASIRAGISALADHFPSHQKVLVFAASRDKDYRGMLADLLPTCSAVVLTRFLGNPRSLPPDELQQVTLDLLPDHICKQDVILAENPKDAWRSAQKACMPSQLIYVAGSFFLAAEILAELES